MKRGIFIFIIITACLIIFAPITIFAADNTTPGFTPLEKLPEIGGVSPGETPSLSSYFQWIFVFGISIAGILAVLMMVIGGIQYVTAYGNPGQVERGKDRITQALLGLLLAVTAWLILYTINPDLAKGKLEIPSISSQTQSMIQMKTYG